MERSAKKTERERERDRERERFHLAFSVIFDFDAGRASSLQRHRFFKREKRERERELMLHRAEYRATRTSALQLLTRGKARAPRTAQHAGCEHLTTTSGGAFLKRKGSFALSARGLQRPGSLVSLRATKETKTDLVAPQISEIEEEVIIEKEEDGKTTSRIIFRIGGMIDVFEVEDLTEKVGWPRRQPQKVKVALENSFMVSSLYKQSLSPDDGSVVEEKLIGIIRVTSDTVFNATLWDVTVDPEYQGEGLGKTIMEMTIRKLLR